MVRANLRLKDMIPALFESIESPDSVKIRVIEDEEGNISNEVVTLEDILNDLYGVKSIYAIKNQVILEVVRDSEIEDFEDEEWIESDEEGAEDSEDKLNVEIVNYYTTKDEASRMINAYVKYRINGEKERLEIFRYPLDSLGDLDFLIKESIRDSINKNT